MKKKALSLLLALVMCLGLATSAMAESSTGNWNDTDAITVDCVEYRDFFILYHHPTFEGEYAYMEPPVTIWMLNPDNLTFSTAGKASDYTVEYFVRGDTPELGDNGNYLYDGKGNVRLSELNGSFANLEKLAGVSMDKILMFVCDSDDFNVSMGWWMAPGSIGAIDMNTMKLGIYSVDAPKVIDPNVGLPAIRSYTDAAFTDVANDWTREGIVNSYELGLMSGVSKTQFSPGGSLTIAEGLTAAGRVFNLWHGGDGVLPQSGATWYDGAVEYAIENGIITRGQFESYDVPATRAQLAGILAKALPKEDYAPINSITSLPDVTADTPYSADIFTLYNAGILTGTDKYGTFHPDAPITRAEVAALLCRLVKPATRKTVTLEELPANRPQGTVYSTSRKLIITGVPLAGVVEINGELYFPIDVLQAYKSWKLIPSSILSDVSFSQTDGGRLGFNVHKYWNPANRPLDEYRIVTPQYLPPAGQVMGTAQLSDAILTVNSTKIEDAIYTIDGCYPMFCLSAIPHEIQNGDVVIDLSGSYKYIPIYDEDLVGAVMPGLIRSTPRETVTAIHDYICNTLTYDESEFNLSSPRNTLTKQGLNASAVTLTVKSGVCEHYAQLFYDMATRAGIPCEKVSGKAGGGNHVWNRVYIDGQWLFVDCTWDDPSWGNLRYNYLLKDAGTMAIDHYWWDTDYPLPTVYDPAWEKIDPNNITTADEFRKCLLAQMVQKKTSITLRVTKSGAYGGLSCCLHADCYGVYYKKLSGGYNSKTNTYNYTVSYWEW